jgi:DNA invertase Pin-like site-specific DNA recombinase
VLWRLDHQQGIDTTAPAGKALFQMMGVFAEFERAMIRERVKTGLARARANAKRLGRPRVGDAEEAEIRTELAAGKGMRKVATELGVGTSTVQPVKAMTSAVSLRSARPKTLGLSVRWLCPG